MGLEVYRIASPFRNRTVFEQHNLMIFPSPGSRVFGLSFDGSVPDICPGTHSIFAFHFQTHCGSIPESSKSRVLTGLRGSSSKPEHEALRNIPNNMTDHHDIDSAASESDPFRAVPLIPYRLSLEEIVGPAREYEDSGIPYVVTGLPLGGGDHEPSPFPQSLEWLDRIYHQRCACVYICVRGPHSSIQHSNQPDRRRPQWR